MKFSNIFLLLLVGMLAFSACETMPDQEVSYSPTFPVSGEYLVRVTNEADGVQPSPAVFYFRAFNTTYNTKDTVWVKLQAKVSGTPYTNWGLLGKALCNPTAATFNVTAGKNTVYPLTPSFTILEGRVLLGKAKVPSGTPCDSVYMKFQTAKDPGKTFIAKGHRRTGFSEDEVVK